MNKPYSIFVVVIFAAFAGTILGNFPNYLHPVFDSHSELYAAILGALIGSTVGGIISFSLSFHEAKMKLTLEKTKLYERLKFATTDVLACFHGAIESPNSWNDQKFRDDGLKAMKQYLDTATAAQDESADLMSPEMALISHFLSTLFANTFEDFFVSPMQLVKIRSSMPILDKASATMTELSALECNFSRTILNSNFFEYCIFLVSPNKELLKWKKINESYLRGLSNEFQKLVIRQTLI